MWARFFALQLARPIGLYDHMQRESVNSFINRSNSQWRLGIDERSLKSPGSVPRNRLQPVVRIKQGEGAGQVW